MQVYYLDNIEKLLYNHNNQFTKEVVIMVVNFTVMCDYANTSDCGGCASHSCGGGR